MMREELQSLVPVRKVPAARYVSLRDIPNPWRSEFVNDSIGAAQPAISGEAECYFVGDWIEWLSLRFAPDYRPLYDGVLYREISDAELDEAREK